MSWISSLEWIQIKRPISYSMQPKEWFHFMFIFSRLHLKCLFSHLGVDQHLGYQVLCRKLYESFSWKFNFNL